MNLNSPYWSLSRKGADFDFATVKMIDSNGTTLPIINTQRSNDYGDPAIIWQVGDAANIRAVAKDTTFEIQVTGIGGNNIPKSLIYRVTLINPDLLTSNQQIAGASSVGAKTAGTYSFTAPPGAEGVSVEASRTSSASWTEDAENPAKSKITDGTTGNYPLVAKTSSFAGFGMVSGKNSFRLTFPTSYDLMTRGVPDQLFGIDRDLIVNSNAKLCFLFRRGFMTTSSTLVVETSTNGGVTWKARGGTIQGVSDTQIDIAVTSKSISLPKSAVPIRVRFRYYTKGGSIYTDEAAPKSPTGIFIDEISTTGCQWLEQKKVTTLPVTATQFLFKSSSAGAGLAIGEEWQLRMRTKLGGKWFPQGPSKVVTIKGS